MLLSPFHPRCCPYLHHWCSEASSCVCTLKSQSFRWDLSLVLNYTSNSCVIQYQTYFYSLAVHYSQCQHKFSAGTTGLLWFLSLEEAGEMAVPVVWHQLQSLSHFWVILLENKLKPGVKYSGDISYCHPAIAPGLKSGDSKVILCNKGWLEVKLKKKIHGQP